MPLADLAVLPATDPTRIYRYRDGLYAVDLLTAAVVHLEFFPRLARQPMTFAAVCEAFDLRRRPADVLLTLLTAMGLIAREGDRFAVTPLGREHLTPGSPFDLTPYYASLASRPVVTDFLRVLRTGRPAQWGSDKDALDWHAGMETEAFATSFTAAMDCRGHYLGAALAGAIDLGGRTRVLDIGGGSGIYACALAARFPGIAATVLEQAPVDAIARRLIAERGASDRVAVETGDLFAATWPSGFDVHLFSNVLHDWDEPEVRALLERSHAHLPPGGLLVIHEAFIDATKTGPLPVAEYSALLMHSTQGKCYSIAEYEAIGREIGFDAFTYRDTVADRGVMTARRI